MKPDRGAVCKKHGMKIFVDLLVPAHHVYKAPEEAEKLSLASQEGQIVLALRGLGDDATTMTIGSNKRDLLALAAAPRKVAGGAVVAPPPDKYRVEVIHGSNRNVVEF